MIFHQPITHPQKAMSPLPNKLKDKKQQSPITTILYFTSISSFFPPFSIQLTNQPSSSKSFIMKAIASALHSSLCLSPPLIPPSNPNFDQFTPKSKSILVNNPLYTQTHPNISLQFKEKILCLEILGIDSGKALALNPSLHSTSLDSIHAIILYLQSKGILQKDLPKIFGMCPLILTSNIKTELNPVFNFLSFDLGVPDHNFRKVINKCPRLLVSSVNDQLKPALSYLRRLGFKNFEGLAYNDPILLVSNVEKTLIPKLDYLIELGFSRKEAVSMVLRCPALFTFSIENNFNPKIEYFLEEMKGNLEELKEFPQYFAFSLEKRIKPRHLEVLESGLKIPLSTMLKATDEEFNELITHGNKVEFCSMSRLSTGLVG